MSTLRYTKEHIFQQFPFNFTKILANETWWVQPKPNMGVIKLYVFILWQTRSFFVNDILPEMSKLIISQIIRVKLIYCMMASLQTPEWQQPKLHLHFNLPLLVPRQRTRGRNAQEGDCRQYTRAGITPDHSNVFSSQQEKELDKKRDCCQCTRAGITSGLPSVLSSQKEWEFDRGRSIIKLTSGAFLVTLDNSSHCNLTLYVTLFPVLLIKYFLLHTIMFSIKLNTL